MDISSFQKRIGYTGSLDFLFEKIAQDYKLGKLKTFSPILQGYEDFNVKMETEKGIFLKNLLSNQLPMAIEQG